ncbi:hypothetical protein GQ600_23475 [Phytophthora cactorum]|nr:hypothetical protein GQ600_23475 [Phytophthora cactorum]
MKFKPENASKYGLVVTAAGQGNVTYRFCTASIQNSLPSDFEGQNVQDIPYRSLYTQHREIAHPTKWAEYKLLLLQQDRDSFFADTAVPFQETTAAHTETMNYSCLSRCHWAAFVSSRRLRRVDTRMRASLVRKGDDENVRHRHDHYYKTEAFPLVVKFVASGSSFHQAAEQAQLFRMKPAS